MTLLKTNLTYIDIKTPQYSSQPRQLEFNCPRKETIDIEILVTSKSNDGKKH